MGKPEKKTFAKEPFFAKEEKKAEPVIQSSGSKLTSDFKNVTKLIQHVDKLDDSAKEAFAKKYNISYKEVSEIRNNARAEFWKGN